MSKQKQKSPEHTPVLVNEVLATLEPRSGESYLDLTAGMGGHAKAVLNLTGTPDKAVLVDRDPQAAAAVAQRLRGVTILNQDFLSASRHLVEEGRRFDLILADLGVSSLHFDDPTRGFSLMKSGPLDMRMDPRQEVTAGEVVNRWAGDRIEALISGFGEEPKAAAIARLIVHARPITDTGQLAEVVAKAYPKRGRRHPATRTFQALRLAVNDELGQLEKSLPLWVDLLTPGGRLAVISFHSLEDRLVKQAFTEHTGGYDAKVRILTKHPITARPEEIAINPRARSAKLRAVAKIKTERN